MASESGKSNGNRALPSAAAWEWLLVGVAVGFALVLCLKNLGVVDLWHDELVHVFVAKDILATGTPHLPSGNPYGNAALFNYLLAALLALFGESERVVRTPAALAAAANVVLAFVALRSTLGRWPALFATMWLALCPWNVAWAREARFYTLQQTFYLCTLWCAWRACEAEDRGVMVRWSAGACAALIGGLLTCYHSVLFIGAPMAYAACMLAVERRFRSRPIYVAAALAVACAVGGALICAIMSHADILMLAKDASIGGQLIDRQLDPQRADRWLYFRWLKDNLSIGYLALALLGSLAMLAKERRRGLFVALAFWVPVMALTLLIGYRRDRFMFFALPFYAAALAYGLVCVVRLPFVVRGAPWRIALAIVVAVFMLRLALSSARLVEDSMEAASGSFTTLAKQHPHWRGPCRYVRDHMEGKAVIGTAYLPVLYYAGRCDNWFPSRFVIWEYYEVGNEGLKTVDDLQQFMADHPQGYFIADWRRFHEPRVLQADEDWVEAHMHRVPEASNTDVTVYAW